MFSELIIAYLFLGGTGAGCAFFCALLGLRASPEQLDGLLARRMRSTPAKPWKRFFASGVFASLGALTLGALCLAFDLGRPELVMALFISPAPTYIAFGAWSLVVCILSVLVLSLVWIGVVPAPRRILGVIEVVVMTSALAVMLYTGVMLSGLQAVPLWNTPWLVALFALSSLSCGIALLLLSALASGSARTFASTISRLFAIDAVLIVLEVAALVCFLVSVWPPTDAASQLANYTDRAAAASVASILSGRFALLFWVGFVGLGLLAPLAQDVVHLARRIGFGRSAITLQSRSILTLSTAVCVLCGGAFLRMIVVGAAMHPLLG